MNIGENVIQKKQVINNKSKYEIKLITNQEKIFEDTKNSCQPFPDPCLPNCQMPPPTCYPHPACFPRRNNLTTNDE